MIHTVKMKKEFSPLIIILSVFFILTVNAFSQEASTEEPEPPSRPEYYGSFGCILPLTGEYAKLGEMALKGVRTAVENMRNYGEYEIVLRDSMSTKEGAYIAFNEIVSSSNPIFIVGPLPSNHIEDIETSGSSMNVPIVIFPVLGRVNSRKNIYNYYLPLNKQTKTLADYSLKELNLKNFAILSPDTALGSNISRTFKEYLRRKGGKVVYDGVYATDLHDIDIHIQWMQAYKLDAIFIPDGAENSSYVIKKIISDDDIANVIFLGPNTWNSSIFYELSKNDFDGILYKIVFTDFIDTRGEDWIKFSNLYYSLYNERPNTFQFQVYSASLFFLEKDIRKRLGEVVKLTSNEFSINPKPLIFTIEDGDVVRLK